MKSWEGPNSAVVLYHRTNLGGGCHAVRMYEITYVHTYVHACIVYTCIVYACVNICTIRTRLCMCVCSVYLKIINTLRMNS